jgi:2,4-dienoyl-CoA reductase (NADPH2)
VPLHRQVTDAVHAAAPDCKICLQILHAGNLAYSDDPVAPSPIASPINPREPREMTTEDIESTIAGFCALRRAGARRRLRRRGDHRLRRLPAEHVSARENQPAPRRVGRQLREPHALPLEIVRRTREAVGPDFIIIYRIAAMELMEDGSSWDEVVTWPRPSRRPARRS